MLALFNNIFNTFIVSHTRYSVIFMSLIANQRDKLGSSEKILELKMQISYFSDAVKVYSISRTGLGPAKYQTFFS